MRNSYFAHIISPKARIIIIYVTSTCGGFSRRMSFGSRHSDATMTSAFRMNYIYFIMHCNTVTNEKKTCHQKVCIIKNQTLVLAVDRTHHHMQRSHNRNFRHGTVSNKLLLCVCVWRGGGGGFHRFYRANLALSFSSGSKH